MYTPPFRETVRNVALGARNPRFGRGLSPSTMLSTTATNRSLAPVVDGQADGTECNASPPASSRTSGSLSASEGSGRSGTASGPVPAGGESGSVPGGTVPPGASGTSGAMPSGDGAPTPGSRRQSTYPPSPATSATIAMPVSHDRIAPLIRLGPRSMRQPPAKHTGARAGMHHCVAADSLADGEERAVPRRMRSVHGSVQS